MLVSIRVQGERTAVLSPWDGRPGGLLAQGLDGDGLGHEVVEIVGGHGGKNAVNGLLQHGVALHETHADVCLLYTSAEEPRRGCN